MNKMSEYSNCSLCDDCDALSKLQTNYLSEKVLVKLCEFVLISSVVIILNLFDFVICSEHKLTKLKLSEIKPKLKRIVHIISLSLLILILPFMTMLIAGALLYKVLCSVVIKRKDRRFVQFLDSFDVFYCLEDRNTTNIEGTIQSNTIELAVDKIREKLRNVFVNYSADKIFYRRNEEYGFYYWRRYSYIDMSEYVQIEEVSEKLDHSKDQHLKRLENCHSSNQIVSYTDEGLFKVLIMKDEGDKSNHEYKVTFKFHHSVKNTALLEFVERLVEKSDDCQVTINSIPELKDRNSPDAIIDMITKLYEILADSLEDNNMNRKKQYNNTIDRLKALEWTKSDENLLGKVKDVCDLNLTDVLRHVLAKVLNKVER